jgi:hypothetical protein
MSIASRIEIGAKDRAPGTPGRLDHHSKAAPVGEIGVSGRSGRPASKFPAALGPILAPVSERRPNATPYFIDHKSCTLLSLGSGPING